MNRRYTKEQYLELAEKIRREIPDMAITTDIIVGFPGETKEDVDETIDVIRRVKYDNAFTFIYSKRTGTPAAAMEQVPEEQVKEQFDRVLKTVQETAREQVSRYQDRLQMCWWKRSTKTTAPWSPEECPTIHWYIFRGMHHLWGR